METNLFFESFKVRLLTFIFPTKGKSILPLGPIVYDPSKSSVSVKLIDKTSEEPSAY